MPDAGRKATGRASDCTDPEHAGAKALWDPKFDHCPICSHERTLAEGREASREPGHQCDGENEWCDDCEAPARRPSRTRTSVPLGSGPTRAGVGRPDDRPGGPGGVMSERERCPRCGGPLTEYPTRLRCYRGDCGWSSEDEGPRRDIGGRTRRG